MLGVWDVDAQIEHMPKALFMEWDEFFRIEAGLPLDLKQYVKQQPNTATPQARLARAQLLNRFG